MVKNKIKEDKEVIILQSKKAEPLSGRDNRRLKLKTSVDQNSTAAWADIDKLRENSNTSVPSLENVIEAKDWVDNGSRL